MENQDCNCIEHFCCGYEAGLKVDQEKLEHPVSIISYHALAAMGSTERMEGNYAVVIYHKPNAELFTGMRTWALGLEVLTAKLGVNITRIVFRSSDQYSGYAFGLVED